MAFMELDVLEKIQETAVKAAGVVHQVAIVALPNEPQGVYGIVGKDGSLEVREVRSVAAQARRPQPGRFHRSRRALQGARGWRLRAHRLALVGQSRRRTDRIELPLAFTPAFEWFFRKAAGEWLQQKLFIRKLRVELADCLTDSSAALLAAARILSFSESQSGYGKVQLGQESLGRDIQEQVQLDQGPVPEQVTFNVRVFTDACLTRRVQLSCAVDINAGEHTFNLAPRPEQLQQLLDNEVAFVGTKLEDGLGEIPVFGGTP